MTGSVNLNILIVKATIFFYVFIVVKIPCMDSGWENNGHPEHTLTVPRPITPDHL